MALIRFMYIGSNPLGNGVVCSNGSQLLEMQDEHGDLGSIGDHLPHCVLYNPGNLTTVGHHLAKHNNKILRRQGTWCRVARSSFLGQSFT